MSKCLSGVCESWLIDKGNNTKYKTRLENLGEYSSAAKVQEEKSKTKTLN